MKPQTIDKFLSDYKVNEKTDITLSLLIELLDKFGKLYATELSNEKDEQIKELKEELQRWESGERNLEQ